MNLLSIKDLAKIGREKPLFTGVTFGLNEGDKAALIGRNGTGKSTLLNTIAGRLPADDGTITINKEAGVSFLPQTIEFNADDSIASHIFRSHSPKLDTIRRYEAACSALEQGMTASAQAEFEQASSQMDMQNLWNYESQVKSILGVLGLGDLSRRMGELSGGMIKKVALAQVLVEDTKLLLLDEPTNHLDVTTIAWLQDYLAKTDRSVLMVTHDRYFLDAVCNNIYELARNRVKLYTGNYSTYLEKKATEAEIEANTERRIESVLRVERDWLMRGPCARGTKPKARKQHDEALINREKFQSEKGFTFEVAGRRLGGKVLELHGVSKLFPKGNHATGAKSEDFRPVIQDFSYKFNKGEKIGVFGDNGTGKSTLLNIIAGRLAPDSGSVVVGLNTSIAYYEQNPTFPDTSLTVLEYVKEAAEVMQMNDGTTLSAALFLEQFGFEGKIQHSPVSTLSGGERKRLYLVRLLLSNPNFLILDEPTNDFDIFTMNILESFLMGFKGCLLIVSHDRYFMDKVADTLFIMEDSGAVSGYVGKCSEYLQYRRMLEAEKEERERAAKTQQGAGKTVATDNATNQSPGSPAPSAGSGKKRKMSFKEQKEFEQLEARIAELEEKLPQLEAEMQGSDYGRVAQASEKYGKLQAELEKAYARWDELSELA
ncbi:MAG: ABC-F family ATP-binding cassette domain-containing protein [Treponema sp.]|nr:ABC-F family ATP-binding cassette domain-containing protein [Treponema sp.]